MRRTLGLLLSLSLLLAGTAPAGAEEEAESEAAAQKAAAFTGTAKWGIEYESGHEVEGPGIVSRLGDAWEMQLDEMSDPRLIGKLRLVLNTDFHSIHGRVWSLSTRIDNELGSWAGTGRGYVGSTDANSLHHQAIYRGTGAYEGLTAMMVFDYKTDRHGYDIHGMVFPGDLPEIPESPGPAE